MSTETCEWCSATEGCVRYEAKYTTLLACPEHVAKAENLNYKRASESQGEYERRMVSGRLGGPGE